MMMQVIWFHLSAVHFILEMFRNIILIKINTIYISTINVFCMFMWTLRHTINIIIFIYICEEVYAEVLFEYSLEKLRESKIKF